MATKVKLIADNVITTDQIDLTSIDTDNLSEGSTNLYFTNARVDSHLSGGTGVTYSSGAISIGQAVATDSNVTFADLTVTGDLNITGDINSYNVTDLDVTDKTITLGAGQIKANSGGSGIIVDGSNASILWDETNDEWDFNKGINVLNGLSVENGKLTINEFTSPEAYTQIRKTNAGSNLAIVSQESIYMLLDENNDQTNRAFFIKHGAGAPGSGTTIFKVEESGNVGIGTDGPDFKLDVVNNNTSQIHFGSADTKGGWLISTGDNQSIISGGAYWSGSQWIATDTEASNVELVDGRIDFYSKTGLTSGSAFSPTRIARFNPTGDLYLTAGNTNSGTLGGDAQIHLGYNGTDNYRHSIRTQHDSGTAAGNKIQFYVWDFGTDAQGALGTKSLVEFNAVNGVDAKAGGFVINGTGVIDSSRNLTNIVGLYGNSGTSNIYATDHYFKDTGGNINFRMNGNVLTLGNDSEHRLAYFGATASSITGTTTDITQLRGRQIDLYAYDDVAIRAGTGDSFIVHTGGSQSFKVNSGGVVETVKMQIFNTDEVESMYISQQNPNTLNGMYGQATDTADIWINYRGYQDGTSYFRDFRFGDGKNVELMHLDASVPEFNYFGASRLGKVRLNTNNTVTGQNYLTAGECFPLVLRARSTSSATNTVAMTFGHETGDYSNFIGSQKTGSGGAAKAEIVFGGRQANGQSFTEWGRWHDDGNLEMPYQSSFHASSSSTIVTISAGDTQTMSNNFDKVNGTGQHNIGSDYNTSTGIYTAPVAGKYLFTYTIRWEVADYTWSSYHRTYISVNNVNDYEAAHAITGNGQPVANYYNHTGSVVVYLGAGDTVRLKGGQSGSASKIYAGESGWSGTYLG